MTAFAFEIEMAQNSNHSFFSLFFLRNTEGDFSNYFSISAYSQSDYTDDITEQNRISIGAPVYLEIKENKAIPNNLEFFLKDCTGYTDIDDPTTYADSSFQFVQVIFTAKLPRIHFDFISASP